MKNDYLKYLETEKKTFEDWESKANQSLKGNTIDGLKKNFDENLDKKVLYTEKDITPINHSYARGLKENTNKYRPWHICSMVDPLNDIKLYNSRILNELERGASSIEIKYINEKDSEDILQNIDLSIAPIFYRDTENPIEGFIKFMNLIKNWELKNNKTALACLEIDTFALSFTKYRDNNKFAYSELINNFIKTITENKDHSINVLSFDGSIWNSLGSSLNQEIGLICLSFIEMVRNNLINDNTHLNFTISLNTDFFLNIAKIRSFRVIINNLYKHFSIKANFQINARTDEGIIFKESPWVNQLRITNAALSAAVANVDRLTCHHITNPLGQAPEFVRRLSLIHI